MAITCGGTTASSAAVAKFDGKGGAGVVPDFLAAEEIDFANCQAAHLIRATRCAVIDIAVTGFWQTA